MAKSRSLASSNYSLIPWLGLALIVILIDQVTKITILKTMPYGASRAVSSFMNIVLVYNPGAAFSFLAAQTGWQRYLFTAIAVGAAVFIIYLLKRHTGQRMFCWALSLILGGAVGNLIDRLIHGHVIDFIDVYYRGWHWPAFNIADSAICIGAALFVLDELRRVGR
jgi:signal peptidase II